MATMQASMEPTFLERLGDGFNAFVEGCVRIISRMLGGSIRRTANQGPRLHPHRRTRTRTPSSPGSVLAKVNDLEPKMQALTDERAEGADGRVPRAAEEGRDARRPAAGGVRRLPRGRPPHQEHAALRRADRRRAVLHGYAGATSPRWSPAKARRSSPRCPRTSTRSRARASTSSPSTTTSPAATASGCCPSTTPWA